jgi:hypothetical protein
MLEGSPSEESQAFHQCERRDCERIFRNNHGYSDFAAGQFDASRISSRECSFCGGTLYLSDVNHTLKVETWECVAVDCDHAEEVPSPSSR